MHWKGVFYDQNWTRVHGFTCLLSHKVVVGCGSITRKTDDQNIDMICIMLT
jgi:hypothetical protein